MSDMTETESMERFVQGLKKAASAARGLSTSTGMKLWLNIANTCDEIRGNGVKLSKMTSLSRFQVLNMLAQREDKLRTITTDPSAGVH